jgi:hypothetical protein
LPQPWLVVVVVVHPPAATAATAITSAAHDHGPGVSCMVHAYRSICHAWVSVTGGMDVGGGAPRSA